MLLEAYKSPLIKGTFMQRYKRFSVEVMLNEGPLWAHCNNSGSMMGLLAEGSAVLLSSSNNPARKMPYTLEAIKADGVWVGVNTLMPNKILKGAFSACLLPFARGYTSFESEVYIPTNGAEGKETGKGGGKEARGGTRIDARLTGEGLCPFWIECKSVTLLKDGQALFPDAKTKRGQKHLKALMERVKLGERAACFYFVQRSDATSFAPAASIDPEYAKLLQQALDGGVEVYAFCWEQLEAGIGLGPSLALRIGSCFGPCFDPYFDLSG